MNSTLAEFQAAILNLEAELDRAGKNLALLGLPPKSERRFAAILELVRAVRADVSNFDGDLVSLIPTLDAKISTLPHAFDYVLGGMLNYEDFRSASRHLDRVAGLLSQLSSGGDIA